MSDAPPPPEPSGYGPTRPNPFETPASQSVFMNPKRVTPIMWVRPVLGLLIVGVLLWLNLTGNNDPIAWGIISLGVIAVSVDTVRIVKGLRNSREVGGDAS